MEEPLLASSSSRKAYDKQKSWGDYDTIGRAGTTSTAASLKVGGDVSIEEIRSAAQLNPYPESADAPSLLNYPATDIQLQGQHVIAAAASAVPPVGGLAAPVVVGRQALDEIETRELLIDHVGHRCCWGTGPARRWDIYKVEDCNVYVGTLEIFIEEREVVGHKTPYTGGKIDGTNNGPIPDIWEMDLRSAFPVPFVPSSQARIKIPRTEKVEKCLGCSGRGDVPCPTCNADQEPGYYKENQLTKCTSCNTRGLIAHKDGSDTICTNCFGKGWLPCSTCKSRGLIKCGSCSGEGSLLSCNFVLVTWRTLVTRKVSASSGAATVPEEVFHRAKGVQLCNTQAFECKPAFFADSYLLNNFSYEVIIDRSPVPPTAKVVCERHIISVVPVTRVTMNQRDRIFSFYIIGLGKEVYMKDYPSQFCWGLCPCLNWLGL